MFGNETLRGGRLPVRGHVVGGENARDYEFPSQLALQALRLGQDPPHRLVCGASILNEHWAVTAAHCMFPRLHELATLSLLSGTTSLTRGGSRHQLKSALVHPGYDQDDYWVNDIALLKVVEPFRLDGATVAAARLPEPGHKVLADYDATVVGWGLLQEEGIAPPDHLQKARLLTTSLPQCKAIYEKINGKIHQTNLCAGLPGGGAGPCRGDSGGPLFVDGVLVGLTSWGAGCGREFPAVFTRVSSYVDWIYQHIQ